MTMQLPPGFKTKKGRDDLKTYLANNHGKKNTLTDLISITDILNNKALDISLEDLQILGETVYQTTFEKLSKTQQEQFVTIKKALQESWAEADDDATASFLRIAARLLARTSLTEEQKASFTASGPVTFWVALSMGASLATLPAAIFSIFAGKSLTEISAWRAVFSAVMATGVGTAIAAFFKIRTTTRKRHDGLVIANIKHDLLVNHNEQIAENNLLKSRELIERTIENALARSELTAEEKNRHEKNLKICKDAKTINEFCAVCKDIQGPYPHIDNVRINIEKLHALKNEIPTDVAKVAEVRQTKAWQVWKYMGLGSGIFTGINATWLFVTVFGSFWGIAKAGIIAGGAASILSGPAFPIVAGIVGALLVATLVGVTIYTLYKKWQYNAEQAAIDTSVKHETAKMEVQESLSKEVKELLPNQYKQVRSELEIEARDEFKQINERYIVLQAFLKQDEEKLTTAKLEEKNLIEKFHELRKDFNSFSEDLKEFKTAFKSTPNNSDLINQKSELTILNDKLTELDERRQNLRKSLKEAKQFNKEAAQPLSHTLQNHRPEPS